MSELPSEMAVEDSRAATIVARESGLERSLRPAQLAMLGLGSTIGTGLFLGSAIAVKRSEEHTSELQSRLHLVCRLLLEKKKKSTHNDLQATSQHSCIVS